MATVDVSQILQPDPDVSVRQDALAVGANLPALQTVDQFMVDQLAAMRATPARDAAIYHLQTGGHRMRARLALASCANRLSPQDRTAAAAACEFLHNASLVHDDISDRDTYRRGRQSVRAVYGDDVALCAGDLLLTTAFQVAARITVPAVSQRLIRFMADTAGRVIGGQSVELSHHTGEGSVRTADYLDATREKTAPLIELALNAGISEPAKAAYTSAVSRRIAEAIGLAYQILDDLDDLDGVDDVSELHPLHAWWHHRPRTRSGSVHLHREPTRIRCLQHARAALNRADRLSARLPEPLLSDVRQLIERLNHKSRQEG
ncbi:polyprenyl synthetase family protein [Spiribacter vilamensis]|uniref:Geranylgeranyl diphosphate synthase type II n=1 Tax=Spiribacter vilamensis TaxID=531306 RepID=A0A4Q8CZD5_9GAMM|nr:polyprenyl synthetase family protein [Spiribacter vilamensis]RZU98297.1 geranylgeranyl diphosphate synthase type II [Spiribacter vilamensis]TVO60811.1 polyprenyl diphosphate synthase [Spiribacter vilamensis]